MKKVITILLLVVFVFIGCSEADIASNNVSRSADSFEVVRRIVFYNGINGDYILVIEGLCSIGNYDETGELTVTCKTGESEYKKHFLGLSDNVTYFAEQVEPIKEDPYFYKVIFRPTAIIPDIDVQAP